MSSSPPTTGVQINRAVVDALPHSITDKVPKVHESTEDLKTDAKEVAKTSLTGLRSLAAGGFGGICAVIVGHPFDLVKVRLQTAEKGVYSGALDVVRRSIARDGLARGLYAGVSAPLVGVTPMCMCFLPPAVSLSELTSTICSRSILLGLRCWQEPRPSLIHSRRRQVVNSPNLRRWLLLRHPYDCHHRTL
jgi:hypothetical protein